MPAVLAVVERFGLQPPEGAGGRSRSPRRSRRSSGSSSGRIRSGFADGRASPTSTHSVAWSRPVAFEPHPPRALSRRPEPLASAGRSRSSAATISLSSPMGSGKVRRTAKCGSTFAGDTGSGSTPIAWSSRWTSCRPNRRASPARGWPERSAIRRSPSRVRSATVSDGSRSAATGRPASAVCVCPGAAIRDGRPRRRLHPRRGPALLPVPPLHGAGPGRPGLLVDRVARPGDGHGLPRIAGKRPGRAQRVGDPGVDGEPQLLAIRPDLVEKRGLPPEEMRASGEVDDEPRGRLLRHPGRELARPAAQRREEGRFGQRVRRPGEERGAHRLRVAERLAPRQPLRLGLGGEGGEHLHVPAFGHDGERPLAPPAFDAQRRAPRQGGETRARGSGGGASSVAAANVHYMFHI